MTDPGFVFVHGGGHGAWCWEPVRAELPRRSIAVDLPGRGARRDVPPPVRLEHFADAVVEDVAASGFDRVVLVGHSMAGLTLPMVVQRLGERVHHAVFLSAIVAEPAQHMLEAVYGTRRGRAMAALAGLGPTRLKGARWVARRNFCHDLPEDREAWLLDHLCHEWTSVTVDPVPLAWSELTTTPTTTYVGLDRDRQLTPLRQRRMVERLGPGTRTEAIDAGHDVMVSHPAELAGLLNALD